MIKESKENITIVANNFSETKFNTDVFVLSDFVCMKFNLANNCNLVNNEIFSNVSTNFTADLETSFLKINTANFISNNLLRRDFANDVINEIISLNENGRQDDSMKEIYTFFDEFLKDDNVEIIDYIFSDKKINSFPNPILVSLLNSTKKIKNNLKNREIVFNKLKSNVVDKIGEQRFNDSLYSKLK